MTDWFFEDSTPILIIGALIEGLLVFAIVQTGRAKLLYAMVGVALLVGGIVWNEKHTVTDRKTITKILYDGAADVERNDDAAAGKYFSRSADAKRQELTSQMAQAKFNSVSLSGIDVEVNRTNKPPVAIAKFIVHATGEARMLHSSFDNALVRVMLKFQLENDHWLVIDYQYDLNVLNGGH